MTIFRTIGVLALCLVALHSETRLQRWGRRAIAAGACAASAIDGYDSVSMIDGQRFSEGNPLLRNPNGTVSVGRLVSLKVTVCAIPIVLGELRWKREAWISGSGSLAIFTTIEVRNRRLKGM